MAEASLSGPETQTNHSGPRSWVSQHLSCLVGSCLLRLTALLVLWHVSILAGQRRHKYRPSRTKAICNFIISTRKRGCCLPALPQEGRLAPPYVVGKAYSWPSSTWLSLNSLDQDLVSYWACIRFIGLSLFYFVGIRVYVECLVLNWLLLWQGTGMQQGQISKLMKYEVLLGQIKCQWNFMREELTGKPEVQKHPADSSPRQRNHIVILGKTAVMENWDTAKCAFQTNN